MGRPRGTQESGTSDVVFLRPLLNKRGITSVEGDSKVPKRVLIRFAADVDAVRRAATKLGGDPGEVEVLRLSELSANAHSLLRAVPRCSHLGLVGTPPEDGIGYGFVPLLALMSRPSEVTLIDTQSGHARSQTLARYLAGSLTLSAGQISISGAAVMAQRLLARGLFTLPRPISHRYHSATHRVTYLRPTSGMPTIAGGPVTHTHEVIRALRRLGTEVACVTTDELIASTAAADRDPPCDWRVVRVPRVFRGVPPSVAVAGDLALACTALASARRSDFIYQRHNRFSLAGVLVSRLTGRPLFLEYNSPSDLFHRSSTPFSKQRAISEDASLAGAARIIVVSDVARQLLVERGIDAERIVVNPNGVQANAFSRGDGPAVRQRLGLEPDAFVIGFVGSFFAFHGTRILAHAFVKLASREPSVRLLLVGDGDERVATEQLLTDAGLANRVSSIGLVFPKEVPAYLDACDVLAAPHVALPGGMEFFGSPTKLFEYMAAGKAIVASRLGQIAEVLDHERSALLVEPNDPSALSAAIARLMNDQTLRAKIGSSARQDAIRRHSWQRNARRLIDAYDELSVDSRGAPR
jgi:glycosyltransferase involved in cell wall biosynthesis